MLPHKVSLPRQTERTKGHVFLGLRGVSDTVNSLMDSLVLISTSQTLKKNIIYFLFCYNSFREINVATFSSWSPAFVSWVYSQKQQIAFPVLPGVGGCENVWKVQSLACHARRAGWRRLAVSTTTGHETGNLPKTGVVLVTPTLRACLRGFRRWLASGHRFHSW